MNTDIHQLIAFLGGVEWLQVAKESSDKRRGQRVVETVPPPLHSPGCRGLSQIEGEVSLPGWGCRQASFPTQ